VTIAFAGTDELDHDDLLHAPLRWPRPSVLLRPLKITPSTAADAAEQLGLQTVGDLLEHLPRDRRESRTVAALAPGESATVVVEVRSITSRPVRRRGMKPLVLATVADETGAMKATFFNQPWLERKYAPGTRLVLHGTYVARNAFRVASHAPTDERTGGEQEVAHYPTTEGLSSTQILALVRAHLTAAHDAVDPLPARVRARRALPDRPAALVAAHAGDHEAGRRRLAFDELLLAQLTLLRRRARRRAASCAPVLDGPPQLSRRWREELLPFVLTGDQRKAMAMLDAELAQPRPMQRLLMGEVGSGKTVVALHAILRAVEHDMQAAFMAPTEVLAEQHFATLQRLLPGEAVRTALLTGSTTKVRRADVIGKLASGELSFVVGTHALVEEDVRFDRLAVVVVDEQHRFGVRQRAALDAKAPAQLVPHVLHMTATPIPRTMALLRYGDLDVTALRELPRGRRPVATHVASSDGERARAYERIREELDAGRQAFVVCPLVEESEALQARAATAEYERLRAGELADYRVALLHGQMRPREKQEAMAAFAAGGEGGHRLLLLSGAHLAVQQRDAVVGQLAGAQALVLRRRGACLQRLGFLDERTDDERLAAGVELLADALVGAGALAVAGGDVRRDRPAPSWQLAQRRDVEVPVAQERHRARDRRGGHVQDVRDELRRRLRVQRRALAHAEAVLLVDDDDRQPVEAHVLLDERVRADDERQLAAGELADDVGTADLGRRAGQQRGAHRLAGQQPLERREVLLGEHLGRRHEGGLHVVLDGAQDRVQRDDGLARADLPHEQALHRARLGELRVEHRHRLALVAGEDERQQLLAPAPRQLRRAVEHGRAARRAAPGAAAQERELGEQQLVEGQPAAAGLVVAGVRGDERRRPVGQRAPRAHAGGQRVDGVVGGRQVRAHEREDLRRGQALGGRVVRHLLLAAGALVGRRVARDAEGVAGHVRAVQDQARAGRVLALQPGLVEERRLHGPGLVGDRRQDERLHPAPAHGPARDRAHLDDDRGALPGRQRGDGARLAAVAREVLQQIADGLQPELLGGVGCRRRRDLQRPQQHRRPRPAQRRVQEVVMVEFVGAGEGDGHRPMMIDAADRSGPDGRSVNGVAHMRRVASDGPPGSVEELADAGIVRERGEALGDRDDAPRDAGGFEGAGGSGRL